MKILDGEDVVVLRRSATDCRQELKSCPPSVRLKLLFVEYILESIKRLPVLSLIFIGYQKLAPCLFMFLIILESSHLLQSTKNCPYFFNFHGILWYLTNFFLQFLTKINIKVPFLGEMIQVSSVNKSVVPGKQSLTYSILQSNQSAFRLNHI